MKKRFLMVESSLEHISKLKHLKSDAEMLIFFENMLIYRLPPLPPTPPKLSSVNFAEYVVIAVRFGSFSDFTNLKMPWVRLSRDWCAGRPSLCVSEVEIQYL